MGRIPKPNQNYSLGAANNEIEVNTTEKVVILFIRANRRHQKNSPVIHARPALSWSASIRLFLLLSSAISSRSWR